MCSVGYFLQSFIMNRSEIINKKEDLLSWALNIFGILICVVERYGACSTVSSLIIVQISNIPMHLVSILDGIGLKHTNSYTFAENIYIVIYVIVRGAFGPWLLVCSLRAWLNSKLVSAMLVLMCLWSYVVIGRMIEVLK